MENDNANITSRCHFLVTCIGIITILISLSVIAGSYYHITLLTSISPNWVNMKVNTAICFMLAGMTLLLINKKNHQPVRDIITATISMMLLLISAMTIVEYLLGFDLGIDELILKDIGPSFPTTIAPGRMALITAIDFTVIALIFLSSIKKSMSAWIVHTAGFLILLIAFISLCNYIYFPDMSYILVQHTTMAMNTSLLFFMMGSGILLLKPTEGMLEILFKKSMGGYLLRYLIPILIVVPVLIDVIVHYFQRQNVLDPNFGDALMAISTIVIIGFFVLKMAKAIDQKEKDVATIQTKIQRNEIIFHQLADNIDIVFYITSPDFSKVIYISPAYEKVWGGSTKSLYKNPMEWFDAVLPEDQSFVYEDLFVKLQKDSASIISNEFRIKRPDNAIRYIFGRITPLKDEKNNVYCNVGLAIDVTNVKTEKIYKALQNNISSLIENEKNMEVFSSKILQLICQALDFDMGELWLLDSSTNTLRHVDVWHNESKPLTKMNVKNHQQLPAINKHFAEKIWESKLPLFILNDPKNNMEELFEHANVASLNSAWGAPIIYKNQIFGVIDFFSFKLQNSEPALLALIESIARSIGGYVEHFHEAEKIKNIVRHDVLTGLLNRSALEAELDKLIADKNTLNVAIMVLDIDRFKLVNESLGHDYGDALLKILASRFNELINYKQMNLSRLSGDKFIFYLPGTNGKEAYDFARVIQNRVSEPFKLSDNNILLSATIGIAVYPQDGQNANTLVVNADLALIEAKQRNENRIRVFTPDLGVIASKTIAMDAELRRAILDNQFILLYQPQINLITGAICAAEVLVRWQHPIDGLTSPNAFIPFAEKNNLIVALNKQIMRMAFQTISANCFDVQLSINISAQQFQEEFHLVNYLESIMKEFSVNAKQVELEITESMLMQDTKHNAAVLTALNQLGFQIAIDDFGTGYSSFSYLSYLPINKIKIDKSFITGLPENFANAKIVKAIISMAHSLGKIVVAEGVETQSEVDFLKQEKCDIIQGFYYYKPMPLDDFSKLFKNMK